MERVADYVIRRLTENGIKHIFMITGRGILYLTDAVAKNADIAGVSTYHEQGASYAAMAYAAASDGMAACLVSTGCAATNAVTAALCAWQDNLPVVFISGQNMLHETTAYTGVPIRTYGSQEADIVSIVKPVVKYAKMLTSAADIENVCDTAFRAANEGRKGPVWIDIPLDVQNERIETADCGASEIIADNGLTTNLNDIKNEDIEYTISHLKNSERPLIFIGGGVRSAGAAEEIKAFIEKCGIPAVYSTSAADTYGAAHELSIGAVGSLGGSRAGNFALQNADFVLVLGSKLCSQTTGDAHQFVREGKIAVVDIDPLEHTKDGVKPDRVINADIKAFLSRLPAIDVGNTHSEWIDKCKSWKSIFSVRNEAFVKDAVCEGVIELYHFADVLSERISDDATLITDAGFEELIIPSAMRFGKNQRCLFPASQGAMGYAIPALIGAHYAGRRDLIAVVGDGSFMMNMQELLTIGANAIPAKIFVINNDMYAVIRKRQKDLFRTRTIGNDPSDGVAAPDFKKIADTFGFEYGVITKCDELGEGIDAVLASGNPYICEVLCDREQKYLHTSFAKGASGRMVRRSLEDLSPFMDRELFYSQMIVKPIKGDDFE